MLKWVQGTSTSSHWGEGTWQYPCKMHIPFASAILLLVICSRENPTQVGLNEAWMKMSLGFNSTELETTRSMNRGTAEIWNMIYPHYKFFPELTWIRSRETERMILETFSEKSKMGMVGAMNTQPLQNFSPHFKCARSSEIAHFFVVIYCYIILISEPSTQVGGKWILSHSRGIVATHPLPRILPDSRSLCSAKAYEGKDYVSISSMSSVFGSMAGRKHHSGNVWGNAGHGHTEGKGPKSRFLPPILCSWGLWFRPMLCEISLSRWQPKVIRLFSEPASQARNVCSHMGPWAQMYHTSCISPFLLSTVRGDLAERRDFHLWPWVKSNLPRMGSVEATAEEQ